MQIETKFVHGGKSYESKTGAISTPIYQTATFKHLGVNQSTGYDYSRTQNPTREKLEKTYALLESGDAGMAFATGMAAVATIIELFSAGDHLLVCDDIYGGSYRFFDSLATQKSLQFSYVSMDNIEEVEAALQANTKAIFFETPTNPMMKVTDIRQICEFAKAKGILAIVDNTFLTPYLQRPLELGADIVISSATKFLAGHNDTLCGLVAAKGKELVERLCFIQNTIGSVCSPFDSWLVLRGIKTLAVRMRTQEENTKKLFNWLRAHPLISKVYYPGDKEHPCYPISCKQASGHGSMISFETKTEALAKKILEKVEIISFAESLGGVESLITYPVLQTHADIPGETLAKLGINHRLLRLSVGIEAAEDLLADLSQAIAE
ncbi:MAG: PLP-dependent aspartate aminotransferase family protein [Spirochaetota bacterium]